MGTNVNIIDYRLKDLNPDYFGISKTYDENWNCIKENHYAVRIPLNNCKTILDIEHVPQQLLTDIECVPQQLLADIKYLNISYRKFDDKFHDEFAISWCILDTMCYT